MTQLTTAIILASMTFQAFWPTAFFPVVAFAENWTKKAPDNFSDPAWVIG